MVPFGTAAIEVDAGWGAGLGDARRMDAFAEGCRRAGGYVDQAVMAGRASGIGAIRYDAPPQVEGPLALTLALALAPTLALTLALPLTLALTLSPSPSPSPSP